MSNTLTGILLAAAAGLNAYIPLLGLALADRATASIDLPKPFDVISTPLGIAFLLFLLTVDLVVDKVPKLDHLNDLVNTALRPAAGMFLVMAVTDGKGEIDEVVAMFVGLIIAGTVHAYKALKRVSMAARSTGAGLPLVSLAEDAICGMLTLLAVALPWAGAAFLAAGFFALAWLYRVMPHSFGGHAPIPASSLHTGSSSPAGTSIITKSDESSRAEG